MSEEVLKNGMKDRALVFSIALNHYDILYRRCIAGQRAYAERYGYDYVLVKRPAWSTVLESVWLKVPLILAALEKGYEWVFFLDADCALRDTAPPFESVAAAGKSLYLARGFSGNLNSGVIIVRNSRESRDFFQRVLNAAGEEVPEMDWGENGHIIHFCRGNPALSVLDARWNNNSDPALEDYVRHYSAGGPMRPLYPISWAGRGVYWMARIRHKLMQLAGGRDTVPRGELVERLMRKTDMCKKFYPLFHSVLPVLFLGLLLLNSGCGTRTTQTRPGDPTLPAYQAGEIPTLQAAHLLLRDDAEFPPPAVDFEVLPLVLSPGDRVRIKVPEGEEFSGIFEVETDGSLNLPRLPPLPVTGLTVPEAEACFTRALVRAGLFQESFARASIRPLQWAPLRLSVAGAVFKPGSIVVNDRQVEERSYQQTQESGDFAPGRYLSAALKGAGGIRPDADIANIRVIRGGVVHDFDLSGIFSGLPVRDAALAHGDHIIVPSLGYYRTELIRPSQVTPPGFKIFTSNLVVPASNNAAAAILRGSLEIPYGTRLLRAVIGANCVGGAPPSNASRSAILVTTNPFSNRPQVIEQAVDKMLAHPDDDEINPYIMPNDGIACYDSGVTGAREIARTLVDFLTPAVLLKSF